jgi:hypothetical protein
MSRPSKPRQRRTAVEVVLARLRELSAVELNSLVDALAVADFGLAHYLLEALHSRLDPMGSKALRDDEP